MARDQDLRKNHEGYPDPTAYEAIKKIEVENARFHKVLDTLYAVAELGGFYIEERIVLKDKRSGKVWR